jgi:hypothetical protein
MLKQLRPSAALRVARLIGTTLGLLAAGSANADLIYDSYNRDSVSNSPSTLPLLTITSAWLITDIQNYHWNFGQGQDPAAVNGQISIRELVSGNLVGSWAASSVAIGVPNTYWSATPNVVLQPGSYTIADSDSGTWSYSTTQYFSGSGHDWSPGTGFSQVTALPVPEPASLALMLAGLAATVLVAGRTGGAHANANTAPRLTDPAV